MTWLSIDTATEKGLVGFTHGSKVLWECLLPPGFQTAQFVLPKIREGLVEIGLSTSNLTGVAVGAGPGSYTGVRVGVIIAQTLAYAQKIPLASVCSLDLFLPDNASYEQAALCDAKLGGIYIKKPGNEPFLCPWNEVEGALRDVKSLFCPHAEALKQKCFERSLLLEGEWIEANPRLHRFTSLAAERLIASPFSEIPQVSIYYLRDVL